MSNKKSQDRTNPMLSAADIIRGGDSDVRQVEVPGFFKNGQTGMVCFTPISAAAMIKFQSEHAEAQQIDAAGGNGKHIERMVEFLQKHLVNPDGSPMFSSVDELQKAPSFQLVAIMKAITSSGGVELPNASREADSSASHTEPAPS